MIMNAILVTLCLSVVYRPSWVTAGYVSLTIAFDYLTSNYLGSHYYSYAAFIDLLVILLIYAQRPTRRGLRLMMLSCVSITNNSIGWVIWNAGYPPVVYNMLSYALYGAAIYMICMKDTDDVALYRISRLRAVIRGDADSRFSNVQRGAKAL